MQSTIKWLSSFESFDYGEQTKPLTLAEASMEAARMALRDSRHFYRVVPVDEAMSGFRVVKISKEKEWQKMQRRAGRFGAHAPYSYHYGH